MRTNSGNAELLLGRWFEELGLKQRCFLCSKVITFGKERCAASFARTRTLHGSYFAALRGHQLPAWAEEFECASWAQFSLKYILGQAGVTCVLAATGDPRHMVDSAAAGAGTLPDAAMRTRMARHMRELLG